MNAAAPKGRPMLAHVGINVVNIDRMVDFYTRFLGLTVSDRGFSQRLQNKFVFLSSDPNVHHQVVFEESREEGSPGNVNQISFRLSSLDELREYHQMLLDGNIEANPVTHGNAWSVYCTDPEGNVVEVYVDAPFYLPQPQGESFDLSQSDAEILRTTREWAESVEGSMATEEWSAGLAKKMSNSE